MDKKIMIIEDNKEVLAALSKIVKSVQADAKIFPFASLNGTYETALNNTMDLFLVDIVLKTDIPGDTSGIRFAKAMRGIQKYEFTPIIFITSLEDYQLHAYSKLHSYSYIEKPFDVEEVKNTVRSALRFPGCEEKEKTLYLAKEQILYALKCSEIVYAESINRQIHFHKTDGTELVVPYKTLKQILDEADDRNLKQCSRKVIFNERYVEYKDKMNRYIKMKGEERLIEIGRTYLKKI